VTEDEPTIHAGDVPFALLAVLERLSPLERVVFVLRSAFDLTFDEIAPVVRRDAVTCRRIFSRGRARVLEERPRFTVDRERHRALLRTFAGAAVAGDVSKLVTMLSDSAVLHTDGGGKALAAKRPIAGSLAIARFIVAVTHARGLALRLHEIDLNCAPALVLMAGARPIVAILIDTDGERIHTLFAVANTDKLYAIASLHDMP
jgi:RNA polymerase sigma-70 factor (ECF subfamily)